MTYAIRSIATIAVAGLAALAALGCGPDDPKLGDTGGGGGGDTATMPDAGDTTGGDASDTGGDTEASDTSGSYQGGVDSPFDDSKQVGTLSEDQQYEVCRAGFSFVTDNISLDDVCLWAAHARSASPDYEDDQAAVDACNSARTQWEENRDADFDPCEGIAGGAECTASVGDWEQCERALSVEFFEHIEGLPACSETTADYYANDYQTYPPSSRSIDDVPEACEALRGSCPEFFKNWVGPVKNP